LEKTERNFEIVHCAQALVAAMTAEVVAALEAVVEDAEVVTVALEVAEAVAEAADLVEDAEAVIATVVAAEADLVEDAVAAAQCAEAAEAETDIAPTKKSNLYHAATTQQKQNQESQAPYQPSSSCHAQFFSKIELPLPPTFNIFFCLLRDCQTSIS